MSRRARRRRRMWLTALAALALLTPAAAGARTATPSRTATPTATLTPPAASPTPQRTGDLGTKRVAGRVYDAAAGASAGIAGATVSYSATHGSGAVASEADGAFGFDLFLHDTDTVTIRASAPGFAAAEQHFTGVGLWLQSTAVEIGLTPAGHRVSGTVSPGQADANCSLERPITLVLDALAPSVPPRITSALPGGSFAFEAVPDGSYELDALSECPLNVYPRQSIEVAGTDVSVELVADVCPDVLVLDPAYGVAGTEVTVTGRCYYIHSGASGSIYFDDAPQTEVRGDTPGNFQAVIRVPDDAADGRHVIRATTRGGQPIGHGDFFVGDPRQSCLGDCDADGEVRINDLLTLVGVVLGEATADVCPAALSAGDETIAIDDLVLAVGVALNGCTAAPVEPTPVPTPAGEGLCYEAVQCFWYEIGPHHPFSTSRASCCQLWTSHAALPFSWCPADQFDAATATCGACEDPC
jgi:hypothetical protein